MILRLRALCPNKTVEMKILTARIIHHMKRGVLSRLRTGLLLERMQGQNKETACGHSNWGKPEDVLFCHLLHAFRKTNVVYFLNY